MCALRAHNNKSFLEKIFLRIEKVLTAFSIFEKIFPKIDGLMCAFGAHINRTLIIIRFSVDLSIHMYVNTDGLFLFAE